MNTIYPVGIVGETNYQPAIRTCSAGERVYVCHEPDNPYDDLALRVETAGGQVIGYIPKSCWLRDAIHEQGKGATSTIKSIADGGTGVLGVVIDVTLTDDDLRERSYGVSAAPPGKLTGLFRSIFG